MIELSADLGEGSPREDEIWPLVDAGNVACGGHTGDDVSMRTAIGFAQKHGAVLGAHPSYPDRDGFGRRTMALPARELALSLGAQLVALAGLARAAGVRVERVKPHGALYNDAHRDAALARLIVSTVMSWDPAASIVCAASSQVAHAARAAGLRVVREAFADRRYESDGSLTPRSVEGSLLGVSGAAEQAAALASSGTVTARDGSRVRIAFDTLCVHADLDGAVERLAAIRSRLGR